MSHPVREITPGEMTPDEMIEHNRRIAHLVTHAGGRFYAGRGRWVDVFGEPVVGPDQDPRGHDARRLADLARIPAFVESPRAVPGPNLAPDLARWLRNH